MRNSPPFRATIRCFGGWQAGVALLAGASLAALLAWLWQLDTARSIADWLLAGAATAVVGAASTCLRSRPVDLRWDSQTWWLGHGDGEGAGDEPTRGRVEVPVDLSSWMLLRFVRTSARGWPRSDWIPVQRRGLELQWHALRCAVHTARQAPAGSSDASGAGP